MWHSASLNPHDPFRSPILFGTQCGDPGVASGITQSQSFEQGRDGAYRLPGQLPIGQPSRCSGGRSRSQAALCRSSCERISPEPCPRHMFSEMLDGRA
ncbi:hypothetical protein T484DRAFT_1978926 [Baffinella frigidus]|nr:hypothetical protein T484DRAFT_1978926 [Cryptophyta sp. CCMP2293]